MEKRTESPPPTTGAIQSVDAIHSVDKYRIRLLMSVLTEWYGRKRLPASKTDWRMASMSPWPIALATQPRHTGFDGWPLMAFRFALSLAIALPLAKWVEAPIRTQRVLKGRQFGIAWAATAVTIVVVSAAWYQG